MNGQEIGIHIRARARMEEVEKAARDLEKFSGSSGKAARMVKLLTQALKEGSETDIDKLGDRIAALQKRIEDPGLGQKQQKLIKDEISGIQSKIKELKQLQKIKADDYGSMEQETRLLLDQLKAKRFITNAEKEHIKVVEEGLRYLEKFNKAKLDLEQTRMGKIQEDWKAQQEQAAKAGIMGDIGARGGRFVRRAAGLVIGGTLLGVAIQSMKKWAEVDTAITRTRASLGGLRKEEVEAFVEIGNRFGYLKKETLEYLDILTRISGKREEVTFGRLLGYGRAMGVGTQALQMREIQRWGGEGVTMGGKQGNVFLGQFTKMAELLRMREGRMGEFIDVGINLTKTMERTFLSVGGQDILRNIMLPAMIWGGEDRGRGMRGFSFMQRIQSGITNPSDIMNLMFYKTLGYPKTVERAWEMGKIIEQGLLGTYKTKEGKDRPTIFGLIESFSRFSGPDKYMQMAIMKSQIPESKRAEFEEFFTKMTDILSGGGVLEVGEFKELGKTDLAKLSDKEREAYKKEKESYNKSIESLSGLEAARNKYNETVKDERKKLKFEITKTEKEGIKKAEITKVGEKELEFMTKYIPGIVKDWTKIGEGFVSEGEKWRVAVEAMMTSIGTFGKGVIPILARTANATEGISKLLYKKLGVEVPEKEVKEKKAKEDIIKKASTGVISDIFYKREYDKNRSYEEMKKKYRDESGIIPVSDLGKIYPDISFGDLLKYTLSGKDKRLKLEEEFKKKYLLPMRDESPVDKFLDFSKNRNIHEIINPSKYRLMRMNAVKYLSEKQGISEEEAMEYLKNLEKQAKRGVETGEISETDKLKDELVANIISGNRQGWKSRISDELTEMKVSKLIINDVEGLKRPQPNITNYYQQITVEGTDTLRSVEINPETGGIIINQMGADNE
ncbi:MAG: hypothetical protein KAW56_17735 [Candidatus Marinimicrobia bacterium]|nr:hypothetical protein [Candidatus Neomarinimicrobiota bacterium]